ncbi:MAG: hypothetical protein SF029_11625 [bacterium]|nr:hypothetical protein [bacterium]
MPIYTCDPNIELNGITTMAFIRNVQHAEIAPILQKHRMDTIDPNAWYPLQDVLNVLSDVSQTGDSMSNFVSLGMAAVQMQFQAAPQQLEGLTLADLLLRYPQVYQARHRGGSAGTISVEQPEQKHIIIRMDIPYPDDVFYGVFYAYARGLLPKGTSFTVKYDPRIPRREEGGSETIIHITWH